MTVSAERLAAWSAANASQNSGQERSGDQGGAVGEQGATQREQRTVKLRAFGDAPERAVMAPQAADVANEITAAAKARLASYAPSEIGAAIEAWDARSDPRITLAAPWVGW